MTTSTSNEEAIKNIQRLATVDKVDFIIPPYGPASISRPRR